MDKKTYLNKIKEYTSAINECVKKGDFVNAKLAKSLMEKTISEYETNEKLLQESRSNNFGMLNDIIVANIPILFKTNKNAVKNIVKTIKEDKNLSAQFMFYRLLEGYDKKTSDIVSSDEYLNNALTIIEKRINRKSILESNKKLSDVLVKYSIKPSETPDKERKAFFESCQNLFSKKNNFANAKLMIESRKNVCNYIDKNKSDDGCNAKNGENIISMMEQFDNKNNALLNEEERELVKIITDFKTPAVNKRKEKLFNSFKNECIKKIDAMMESATDSDKDGLISLKEKINNKVFCEETIVADLAKLLEIRDILEDK